MELEELVNRYRDLPMKVRAVICVIFGLLAPAYTYSDSGEFLLEDLQNAKNGRDGKRAQFERARSKKGNLPKLEEQMAFTEQQLIEAQKQLPDTFIIEDLLQRLAAISNESGVVLRSFKPDAEPKAGEGEYKYMQLGQEATVEGRYNAVANFLDKVAHLESSIFIKSIEMTRKVTKPADEQTAQGTADNEVARHKTAIDTRKNTEVETKITMVAYRSMTAAEEATANPPIEGEGGEGGEGGDGEDGEGNQDAQAG